MILYFDTFITDSPLVPGFISPNITIRQNCAVYQMPKKVDIAKYTLATYQQIEWSDVYVKYELDHGKPTDYIDFDRFIYGLYPCAQVVRRRSESVSDFRASWKCLSKLASDWIFLANNNDHPLLWFDPLVFGKIMNVADQYSNKGMMVSIVYSHFSEFVTLRDKTSPFSMVFGHNRKILYEDECCFVLEVLGGDFSSVQILNKKLFENWFVKTQYTGRVIRSEDLASHANTPTQIQVIPKVELCAHFDGYSHTSGSAYHIVPNRVPPLFIPQGFFGSDIKISLGRKPKTAAEQDVIVIGEAGDKYAFLNRGVGCHLKGGMGMVPDAWAGRISEIWQSDGIDLVDYNAYEKALKIRRYPYSVFPLVINMQFLKFIMRLTKLNSLALFNALLCNLLSKLRRL